MKFKVLLLVTMTFAFTASTILANPVIFSQPYDPNSPTAFISANRDGVVYYQGFADYYYDNSSIITDFHWWGLGDTPVSFDILIYENDDRDLPGQLAYSQSVAYGNVNAELVDFNVGHDVFKYSMDFTEPYFGAESGLYWFSVVAYVDSPELNWAWALAGNDSWNRDVQFSLINNVYFFSPGDNGGFAFELTGVPAVPEPATLTLFGLGLLGSALARRRRNKK